MVAKEESLDGITLILLRRGLGRIEALSSVATTSSKLQYLQVSNETPPPVTSDEALKMTLLDMFHSQKSRERKTSYLICAK